MSSVVYEIECLIEEIPQLPEGKEFRNLEEILDHDEDTYCLVCHQREDNTLECPPYGRVSWHIFLIRILAVLEHFKVHKYGKIEKNIFLNSIKESGVLRDKDDNSFWFLARNNSYDTYEVKKYIC